MIFRIQDRANGERSLLEAGRRFAETDRHERTVLDMIGEPKGRTGGPPGSLNLPALNRRFESTAPEEILLWAWDSFRPDIALSSSFQSQSVPLLHMLSRVAPEMPVLFCDTGFHFPETLAFRDRLVRLLGLDLRILTTRLGAQGFRQQHGLLYRSDPDLCCYLNKVEPMRVAQESLTAWVTGIRRDQTALRRTVEIVSRLENGVFKICPLATWTSWEVESYIRRHDLPTHPLADQGYRSIGCAPCTAAVAPGEADRAGRWKATGKTECGLHVQTPSKRGSER